MAQIAVGKQAEAQSVWGTSLPTRLDVERANAKVWKALEKVKPKENTFPVTQLRKVGYGASRAAAWSGESPRSACSWDRWSECAVVSGLPGHRGVIEDGEGSWLAPAWPAPTMRP